MKRFVLLGLAGVCACAQPSATHAPASNDDDAAAAEPVVIAEPSPSERVIEEAEPIVAAPASTDATALAHTGIPECDAYLGLYKRCEKYLEPEIMTGSRRFHHAEAASLVYHAGTSAAASLPSSCKLMLDELQVDCPEQHRTP